MLGISPLQGNMDFGDPKYIRIIIVCLDNYYKICLGHKDRRPSWNWILILVGNQNWIRTMCSCFRIRF